MNRAAKGFRLDLTTGALAKDVALLVWRILATADDIENRTGTRPTRAFIPVGLWPDSLAFGAIDVGNVHAERSRFAPEGRILYLPGG